MVLRKSVVQISSKNYACAINQHVQSRLKIVIFLYLLDLVRIQGMVCFFQLNELISNRFNQILNQKLGQSFCLQCIACRLSGWWWSQWPGMEIILPYFSEFLHLGRPGIHGLLGWGRRRWGPDRYLKRLLWLRFVCSWSSLAHRTASSCSSIPLPSHPFPSHSCPFYCCPY